MASEAFLQGLKDFLIGCVFQDSVYHVGGPDLQDGGCVDFSRLGEQLCSATVSNWRRNTAHGVVPSNLCGFVAPAPVPLPFPCSASASSPLNCVWNSRRVAFILFRLILIRAFIACTSDLDHEAQFFMDVVLCILYSSFCPLFRP
jgi:hypothetical protein